MRYPAFTLRNTMDFPISRDERTLAVMRVNLLLSTPMQTRNLSKWIVHFHFQVADRLLEEHTVELDMGRVKKFARFIRVRLVERCPFMKSAQFSQIHDSSMLTKSGAEFSFSKDLVCKATHAHFAIHERNYGGLSEVHFVNSSCGHISGPSKTKRSCFPCSCRRTSVTA